MVDLRIKPTHGWIYCITNKVNGKKYVGQTTATIYDRWKGHLAEARNEGRRTAPLDVDIRGATEDKQFLVEELEYVSAGELCVRERHWIDVLKSLYPSGYNKTTGGWSGYSVCEETRLARGKVWLGKKHTAESCANMRDSKRARCGRPVTLKNSISGETYSFGSRAEAAEFIGVPRKNMIQAMYTKNKNIAKIWAILHSDA